MRTHLGPALAVLLMTTMLGACTRGESEPIRDSNEDISMELSVKLRGDLEIDVPTREAVVKVVKVEGSVGNDQKVLGVEVVDFLVEGPLKVRPGVAVVGYRGNGSYTIPPGSPFDAVEAEEEARRTGKPWNRSSVRVEWWPADGEPEFYLRREKPCTVKVDDGGMKGSVRCPRMTQEGSGGKRFSLEFRWEKA